MVPASARVISKNQISRPADHVVGLGKPLPRPRIAIVAPDLKILGGQELQATNLIRELQKEGYGVDFIPQNPRFPPGLRWIRHLPYARTLLNEALYLPSLLRLRHVDVVHVFCTHFWSFLLTPVPAVLAGRALGKRVLLNYRSGEAENHLARWGALVHPWLRLADAIVVPSEYLRAVFARYGYQACVIRNVVDTSRFRYRERVPLRPRLVSARNFGPFYRVDNTLNAYALLKPRYPEMTLTIAGYGRGEGELRRLADSLGTNGVRFMGRVDPALMPALYDEADIFVNSSVVDNQPNSVLEAFAAGLPVVSTPTGDIKSMVRDGETGLIVPPGDPVAMAGAVALLLEHPERALCMARRARQEVEKYTWSQVRDGWAAVYCGGRRCGEALPVVPQAGGG